MTASTVETIGTLDHDQHNEYLVFGPPGCGKSTNLSRQIGRAAEKFGADSVLCTSFSKAAAAELVKRDLPIPRDAIGTLHSHCFRALGGPQIAEAHVEQWNKENDTLQITPQRESSDAAEDVASGTTVTREGDMWLSTLNVARAKMLPRDVWSQSLIHFEKRWSEYKQEYGLMDFTDLIENALREIRIAPGNPRVIFADEAQDFTRLQFELVRRWGRNAEYFVMAGDDDQCIFSFSGASPEPLVCSDVPESHKIVLKQSYRVPYAVQAAAERLIKTVSIRQPKEYRPRDEEGVAGRLYSGTWEAPESIVDHAEWTLAAGKTVMFLASCSFFLQRLITVLRKRGIPFHNRYRLSNGQWNPLKRDAKGGSVNRILSLFGPHPASAHQKDAWTFGDVALWSEWLEAKGILQRGAKKRLTECDHTRLVGMENLADLFEEQALDEMLAAFEGSASDLIGWWQEHLAKSFAGRAEFAATITRKRGPAALLDVPKVTVGTIHSVKGGEADVVYLLPDLSRAGWQSYEFRGDPHDSVVRLFYVGMTRARQELYWCQQASPRAFQAA